MSSVTAGERDVAFPSPPGPAVSRPPGAVLPRGVHGAADPAFALAVRAFAETFPWRRFGGGALAVYLDGQPVVDVWTGYADRRGTRPWTANTGAMVFSATKGLASTVIHRLADRGLIDYDAPVADHWPAFAAKGKARVTVREMMRHRAGLAHLNGATGVDLMDHLLMEERMAAAPMGLFKGRPAYHAITYGWLMSGLARAVTGRGMRDLFRAELALPLNTDGIHLGRPPIDAPTQPARIIGPQGTQKIPFVDFIAPRIAGVPFSGGLGSLYFPGMSATVQGDIPLLDAEFPAANGVATARALARMYGAIANGGAIDGNRFLSRELTTRLVGRPSRHPDGTLLIPLSFHLGYHGLPWGNLLPGFGHAGLAGSVGWADPVNGFAFGFVHNRLLTPLVALDQAGFVALGALIRRGVAAARKRGFTAVTDFGAGFPEVATEAV